jgi:hypothetical protein
LALDPSAAEGVVSARLAAPAKKTGPQVAWWRKASVVGVIGRVTEVVLGFRCNCGSQRSADGQRLAVR